MTNEKKQQAYRADINHDALQRLTIDIEQRHRSTLEQIIDFFKELFGISTTLDKLEERLSVQDLLEFDPSKPDELAEKIHQSLSPEEQQKATKQQFVEAMQSNKFNNILKDVKSRGLTAYRQDLVATLADLERPENHITAITGVSKNVQNDIDIASIENALNVAKEDRYLSAYVRKEGVRTNIEFDIKFPYDDGYVVKNEEDVLLAKQGAITAKIATILPAMSEGATQAFWHEFEKDVQHITQNRQEEIPAKQEALSNLRGVISKSEAAPLTSYKDNSVTYEAEAFVSAFSLAAASYDSKGLKALTIDARLVSPKETLSHEELKDAVTLTINAAVDVLKKEQQANIKKLEEQKQKLEKNTQLKEEVKQNNINLKQEEITKATEQLEQIEQNLRSTLEQVVMDKQRALSTIYEQLTNQEQALSQQQLLDHAKEKEYLSKEELETFEQSTDQIEKNELLHKAEVKRAEEFAGKSETEIANIVNEAETYLTPTEHQTFQKAEANYHSRTSRYENAQNDLIKTINRFFKLANKEEITEVPKDKALLQALKKQAIEAVKEVVPEQQQAAVIASLEKKVKRNSASGHRLDEAREDYFSTVAEISSRKDIAAKLEIDENKVKDLTAKAPIYLSPKEQQQLQATIDSKDTTARNHLLIKVTSREETAKDITFKEEKSTLKNQAETYLSKAEQQQLSNAIEQKDSAAENHLLTKVAKRQSEAKIVVGEIKANVSVIMQAEVNVQKQAHDLDTLSHDALLKEAETLLDPEDYQEFAQSVAVKQQYDKAVAGRNEFIASYFTDNPHVVAELESKSVQDQRQLRNDLAAYIKDTEPDLTIAERNSKIKTLNELFAQAEEAKRNYQDGTVSHQQTYEAFVEVIAIKKEEQLQQQEQSPVDKSQQGFKSQLEGHLVAGLKQALDQHIIFNEKNEPRLDSTPEALTEQLVNYVKENVTLPESLNSEVEEMVRKTVEERLPKTLNIAMKSVENLVNNSELTSKADIIDQVIQDSNISRRMGAAALSASGTPSFINQVNVNVRTEKAAVERKGEEIGNVILKNALTEEQRKEIPSAYFFFDAHPSTQALNTALAEHFVEKHQHVLHDVPQAFDIVTSQGVEVIDAYKKLHALDEKALEEAKNDLLQKYEGKEVEINQAFHDLQQGAELQKEAFTPLHQEMLKLQKEKLNEPEVKKILEKVEEQLTSKDVQLSLSKMEKAALVPHLNYSQSSLAQELATTYSGGEEKLQTTVALAQQQLENVKKDIASHQQVGITTKDLAEELLSFGNGAELNEKLGLSDALDGVVKEAYVDVIHGIDLMQQELPAKLPLNKVEAIAEVLKPQIQEFKKEHQETLSNLDAQGKEKVEELKTDFSKKFEGVKGTIQDILKQGSHNPEKGGMAR